MVLTYPGVSLLHALWDSMHGIAIWIVTRLTAADLPLPLLAEGCIPQPTGAQEHLFTLFPVGGLVIISLAGIAWVRSLTRRDPSWRNTP
ncbi:hypothetical protein [Streptomyces sp. NPDC048641]|uniref:hypothetical protein n=1 Tax=unclassified Streptomyces TaxID=2593676 RepID=UPI003447A059